MEAKRKRFTNDEDKVIVGMYNDKLSAEEIANTLGRTVNSIRQRVFFLRKKGVIQGTRQLKWTDALENELVNTIHKNPGNLSEGFREFAEKHNSTFNAVSNYYYTNIIDTHFIFSLFGRFRKSNNRKIYKKEQARGHKMWTIIKAMFN